MAYPLTQAQSLEAQESRRVARQTRPAFEVVEGAGLDARVRQGVSDVFLSRVRMAALAIVVFAVLAITRVTLYAATASSLQANAELRSQIKMAQSLENDLKVTSSALSNSSRIDRIATQNYGMVRASQTEVISLGGSTQDSFIASTGDNDKQIEGSKKSTNESTKTNASTSVK
ncbi:FtsB/FtsL family cell division protein [Atopobium fossor]|uniref:hypothetical protein n=1 Tax=Atopobium fossor TaxID=39487 RepID=UPI0003F9DF1B|nr:hypothetical protein [Atopobium fossor]